MAGHSSPSTLFGRRLREARERVGIPQDKLGVGIGLDEGTASARISRYETGKHEPPYAVAAKLADALGIPDAYMYCADDQLASIVEMYGRLSASKRKRLHALAAELAASKS